MRLRSGVEERRDRLAQLPGEPRRYACHLRGHRARVGRCRLRAVNERERRALGWKNTTPEQVAVYLRRREEHRRRTEPAQRRRRLLLEIAIVACVLWAVSTVLR